MDKKKQRRKIARLEDEVMDFALSLESEIEHVRETMKEFMRAFDKLARKKW